MGGKYLRGAIPRIESKSEHLELSDASQTIDAVMISYPNARRLDQNGIDLSELKAKVILSSTIPDEQLEEWFPERELALAKRLGADAIVPCDRPVYDLDARVQRIETVRAYVADLLDIIPKFRDAGVEVVPLVKGETEYERGLCYDAFDDLSCTRVAYYCVQYFTYGYRYKELLERIQRISIEYEPEDMMLIGFQSENLVSNFPPCVTGLAGQRWLRNSNPRVVSVQEAARNYDLWSQQVDSTLCIGQQPLHAFEHVRGWV
ncbi:hypothetical protein NDI76_02110 [Halogeometricum sp. S1BR25-6]|uniref:Uncharacterized protein n=1 Tax=Halogeometricum salsisoli TaxID=2950536 RepID=A0ABU2G9Q9_9EURY|nr:hypothetical protein [Halogeometricum sp. S1BR25-6]MDS0297535.1 hypothetical protein [Halogeometricum sp. S1BR25-6]